MTPWTVAHQAPLSMGFSRQEYWSGLPFPSPGDLPNPDIEPGSSGLQADSLPSEPNNSILFVSNKDFHVIPCTNTDRTELSRKEVWLETILWSARVSPHLGITFPGHRTHSLSLLSDREGYICKWSEENENFNADQLLCTNKNDSLSQRNNSPRLVPLV